VKWKNLRSEIDAHIEEKAFELIESGVPEQDAWMQARREFGNPTLTVESSRDVWIWTWAEHLMQDVRYAFRTMASNRAFTLLAIASLALGIGANTAIYSFMDAILLRALPVTDPESLVMLKFQRPGTSKGSSNNPAARVKMSMSSTSGGNSAAGYSIFPYPIFELFRARADLFTDVFAYHGRPDTRITVNGIASLGDSVYVSGDYFRGLGIAASAGRGLTSEDEKPGAPPVAVISAGFAQNWYGRASDAVGKSVAVNGVNLTVIGVAPPEFFGVNPASSPEVYLPLHSFVLTQPASLTRDGGIFEPGVYWLEIMARLKPGVSREQAQSALDPVFAAYFLEYSGGAPEKARMLVLEGAGGLDSLRLRYSRPLFVLLGMVGLILAIACANIASLLLARASARRREMAVRLSMGASRLRVIRQLLTESLVLSVMGGAAGLLFAWWSVQALTASLGMGRDGFTLRAGLSWPVLGAAFVLATLAGLAFGLAPAWQSTKVDVVSMLHKVRASGSGSSGRGFRVSLRQALVVAQIAVSFLMLIGAGLFVRTLSKLESLNLGFNRENLLLLEINTQQAGYDSRAALEFHETLRQRLENTPGVRGATLSAQGQLNGGSTALRLTVPGSRSEDQAATALLPAGPHYLTTMQIPILAGRDLVAADRYRKPITAVASESFARKHFGTDNPLGRRLSMRYGGDHEVEIVGVAKDARYGSLKNAPPAMLYVDYYHNEGFSERETLIVLRTAGEPLAMAGAAREILRQADPGVPVTISTQAAQIDSTINQEIIFARLCTAFALLALTISCVGLYGTTAYNVSRRTSEIGIRMALGAQRGAVLSMVLRETAVLGIVGIAIGLPVALAASKLVASFLFDLQPNDAATIAGAVVFLMAAALPAAYGPARRATRIHPITALRHE
jgi:macrolide transport system ATP-binding/permease protein